jgi:hypothetical protein
MAKHKKHPKHKERKALLKIFMPAMRAALKKRHIQITNKRDIEEVSTKFYQYVLKKQLPKHYEVNHAEQDSGSEHFVEAVTAGANIFEKIITAIVNFFKNLKKRKDKHGDSEGTGNIEDGSDAPLNSEEHQILKSAEAEAKAQNTLIPNVPNIVTYAVGGLIIAKVAKII